MKKKALEIQRLFQQRAVWLGLGVVSTLSLGFIPG